MDYRKLINNKTYEEMTKVEIDFCNKEEIKHYKPKIDKLKEKGIEDYKLAAYINDLYQDYLIAEIEPLADDICHISDEDWEKGVDYYWRDMNEKNPLIDYKKELKETKKDYKYRIDFYFWTNGCGFDSCIQTVQRLNTFIDAKEYVSDIDIDYFTEVPYDAIMVRTVDNENDYVLSEFWWDIKN